MPQHNRRLSYLPFALVGLHTLLYQRLVQPGSLYQFLLALPQPNEGQMSRLPFGRKVLFCILS